MKDEKSLKEIQEALHYHQSFPAGKIQVSPTKKYNTQKDLSLAYSPGVAEPCKKIKDNPLNAYKYTSKGNLVGVISNGSAVLGLGNIGALASKPVMEGKALLFKIFAGIDVFDIEINEKDPDKIVDIIKAIAPTFGGINLEDIKAPEAFEIERRLKKELDIPIMHDDQHGTAIISGAALLNALELAHKRIDQIKMVINGAGAAAISCARMYKELGVLAQNIIMCDSKGVIHDKREDLNKEKLEFVIHTPFRTLKEALKNADVFIGLSIGNVMDKDMLKSMAKDPIVFAMANPQPEIEYDLAKKIRPDVIMATGRSDYPNQVNNVLGFPYLFRGALDVHAKTINEEMKLAAINALVSLTKEEVIEQVKMIYNQKDICFGRDYIIPKPFDPRLITKVAPAVAKAAMASSVAQKPIEDWELYHQELLKRMGFDNKILRMIQKLAKANPKRIVFSNGEEYNVIRAAQILSDEKIAYPILLGNRKKIEKILDDHLIHGDFSIIDPQEKENEDRIELYAKKFWEKRQRKGLTYYDAQKRMTTADYFGAMMVENQDAEAFLNGYSKNFSSSIKPILEVIGRADEKNKVAGMMILLTKNGPLFLADTALIPEPNTEELISIALMAADIVKVFGIDPSIAMLSFENFSDHQQTSFKITQAVAYLHQHHPSLLVDGPLQADFALDKKLHKDKFPFSKLANKEANIFIFPNLSSSNLTYKFIRGLGDIHVIGPFLLGVKKSAHVMQMQSTIEEIVELSSLALMNVYNKKFIV